MMETFLTGLGIASIIAATKIPSSPSQNHLKECLHAYYADKYNGRRDGNPGATFMTCLEVHNRDLFKNVKEMYMPPETPQ
jgi:hypothetical protein